MDAELVDIDAYYGTWMSMDFVYPEDSGINNQFPMDMRGDNIHIYIYVVAYIVF